MKYLIDVPGTDTSLITALIKSSCLFSVAYTALPPPDPVASAVSLASAVNWYVSWVTLEMSWVPFKLSAAIPLNSVAPDIITTGLFAFCIPWFLWNTVTTPLPSVLDIGLRGKFLAGISSCTRVISAPELLNTHLFNLNFKSLLCSGVHVEAFCEVKNTPPYGCFVILFVVFVKSNPPISAT